MHYSCGVKKYFFDSIVIGYILSFNNIKNAYIVIYYLAP